MPYTDFQIIDMKKISALAAKNPLRVFNTLRVSMIQAYTSGSAKIAFLHNCTEKQSVL